MSAQATVICIVFIMARACAWSFRASSNPAGWLKLACISEEKAAWVMLFPPWLALLVLPERKCAAGAAGHGRLPGKAQRQIPLCRVQLSLRTC